MALKTFKPTSPGVRQKTVADFSGLSDVSPHKPLTRGKKRISGRNNKGRITVWWRGGGHKRRYREIDFKRNKYEVPGTVATIEYDPNRSARIALVHYADGEKRYILAPVGLEVGQVIVSTKEKADIVVGNSMPLSSIPQGTMIHNIELKIGKGGQMARSAGSYAQVLGREGQYVILRLPSTEVRKVHERCRATVGQIGNLEHENVNLGKAGRNRWLGRRPHVRGVAMNPIDHPHGGGEGRTSGGRHPVTPWGQPTKGYKTRNKNKASDKYIVRRRKK